MIRPRLTIGPFLEHARALIGKDIDQYKYTGFDMGKTHDVDHDNIDATNNKVLHIFQNYIDVDKARQHLDCWKGRMYWKERPTLPGSNPMADFWGNVQHDFFGWPTEEIIWWIAENYPRKLQQDYLIVTRYISTSLRYQILHEQKWRCNECASRLKFDKSSSWEGEVAHIDHIHPYSKRLTYPNGVQAINERSNLQALCPSCNEKKRNLLNAH